MPWEKLEDSAEIQEAPGQPGIAPRWASSAKSGVGTAASAHSRVWFTLSHGIVNEVYYPRLDQANTRDLGLLVADGQQFFSEEKRHTTHTVAPLAPGVPGYRFTNTCMERRYRLEKVIITDPQRDVLLQSIRFLPLQGALQDYGVYVLLAPHIGNGGADNSGWVGAYKGMPMLFAEGAGATLALACSVPFRAMSCGYVRVSDGWQDIAAHKRMTWQYTHASHGNIALTAALDLQAGAAQCCLALAFGRNAAEAGQRARAALLQDMSQVIQSYVQGWQALQAAYLELGGAGPQGFDLYRVSTAVLQSHTSKAFSGGMIASLSIPWGTAKGDEDLGGYHLVWPRDLVESAGGLLAAGDLCGARQVLQYLMSTQEADGHWAQNLWLDGTPYWNGVQLDETALPILLADALWRQQGLAGLDTWPMVRDAARFLVCQGPVTQQDRWEEDGGYAPFTLAVVIAALLAAADGADRAGESVMARYLRQTADLWNAGIERWTYVMHTELAQQCGVEGYYVRIAPPETADASSPAQGFVPIKNRPPGHSQAPMAQIVSPDALALVRFGLRAADDPRIRNTIKVIDATLRTQTATGPVWHRYTQDGYGEHDDGSAFDGTGVGRGWPLLAGERAHYELARGHLAEARQLAQVMAAQASPGGLLPEQVWDATDVPALELYNGQPSGSAMPLVWAHAEYIKLLRSLHDGHVFDMPPQPVQRYQVERRDSPFALWRMHHKCRRMPAGKHLRVEVLTAARLHWSMDAWQTIHDVAMDVTGLGVYVADLPTAVAAPGTHVVFTFFWLQAQQWEGVNYEVKIGA